MPSPPLIGLRAAKLSFGDKQLFDGLSIFLGPGDHVSLVGLNGTGKSTLMKCLMGEIPLDAGERFVQPGTTIAWVPQEVTVPDDIRLVDFVCRADRMEQARDGLRAAPEDLPLHKGEEALERLDLDPGRLGANLSGGETRRVAIARALAREPGVLLLDEPTNHLDLAAIEWLEGVLKRYQGAMLLISHDRAFLNSVSTATAWLQRRYLLRMDKPFSEFETWSEDILDLEMKEQQKLSRKIDRETAWLHRGVTARRRRNQRRLRKLHELRAARRERQAGKSKVSMAAGEGPPASQLVVDAWRVSKSFNLEDGSRLPIVNDFSTRILRGDRVGLLGPNGAGKTTLLRMLIGENQPDSGRIKMGQRTEVAYFDQTRSQIDPKLTPWQFLCPQGGDQVNVRGRPRHVVGYLKEFLFDEDDARSLIGTLSGGQRNRLMLARVLAQPSNLLVLDEPTNDLDMDTLDQLQETLDAYDGTLLVVSHDRDFLDKLVTSLIVLEGEGEVQEYVGGYADYLRQRGPRPPARAAGTSKSASRDPVKESKPDDRPRPPAKLSYKDQRALDLLPDEIGELEEEIAGLNRKLSDPGLFNRDPEAFQHFADRLEAAEAELSAKETLWLELEDRRERLSSS